MSNKAELDAELAALNAEWERITAKRKAWMDAHMADYARWPIGTELYYLENGQRFGTITEYYRYQSRDPQYDRSMSIEYRVHTHHNCYDNTSRFGGAAYLFGTKEEARERFAGMLR